MRWNGLDTIHKRFVLAVLIFVSILVCTVLIINAVMESRSRKFYSTEATYFTLSQTDRDRLTIHENTGLPEEYHELLPLHERFQAPLSKQNLGVTRVYPDGVVFSYGRIYGEKGNTEEYVWSRRGKLQRQDLERLHELLESDELVAVYDKARQAGPCEHVSGGWRSYRGNEVREIVYSASGDGGRTPDILWDLSSILHQIR